MKSIKRITVSTDRGSFELIKDYDKYLTYWVCTDGYCPGSLSEQNAGIIVPVAFRSDLYKLARKQGYSSDDLAAPKRPEKKASGGGGFRRVKKKKTGIHISLADRMKKRMARVKTAPATAEA